MSSKPRNWRGRWSTWTGVTAPRSIQPGRTYLITRRCTQRQFLLRPDETTEQIFLYCLAEAAERFGVGLVAWTAMSNHYHVVVEDTFGLLPAFLAHLNKILAKVFNTRWDRAENLWASEQASAVWLVDQAAVLDKVVYTLANPMAADLVDGLFDWPGASSLRWLDGRTVEIPRPRIFFRERGDMPASVSLGARAPTGWPGGMTAWATSVRTALEARQATIREERLASGRRIVGRKAVLRASPFDRPSVKAARGGLRPRLACGNPGRRTEALRWLEGFRRSYSAALERVRDGGDVTFPAGTYKLARDGLVRVGPASAASILGDGALLPLTTSGSWGLPP